MNKAFILPTIFVFLFGVFVYSAAATDNLALSGNATQSSTWWGGGDPSRANDGNTDGNYYNLSVSHTNYDQNAWWQVDLGDSFLLDYIVLWNRTDAAGDRLTDFNVSVFDQSMTEVFRQDFFTTGGTFPTSLNIDLPSSTYGQFVQVQLNHQDYLHLAEVQVFGVVPEPISSILFLSGGTLFAGRGFLRRAKVQKSKSQK